MQKPIKSYIGVATAVVGVLSVAGGAIGLFIHDCLHPPYETERADERAAERLMMSAGQMITSPSGSKYVVKSGTDAPSGCHELLGYRIVSIKNGLAEIEPNARLDRTLCPVRTQGHAL